LLEPGIMRDICLSLADLYRTGKTESCTNFEPTPGCRSEHALVVLLDAYQKGIRFDVTDIYSLMVEESDRYHFDSPDKKLESAYDFWALSEFAHILDKKNDHALFRKRSQEYRAVWKDKFKIMDENADIMHGDGLYEGTLWQYRWFVPHDIPSIVELIGGEKKFTADLSFFFENNLYNHGNQPDIHVPFLFNFGNSPWLTQKWVNAILTKEIPNYYGTHKKWKKPYVGRIYKATPDGYIPEMDDDAGTMSSWYVFASMGLYPYCPGKPEYTIRSPIFDSVKINLKNGNTFEIQCKNLSDENFYIQSAELNGQSFDKYIISHADILKGGVLKYVMGPTPKHSSKSN
jgi:predicted alpha-1,2-mannosidase